MWKIIRKNWWVFLFFGILLFFIYDVVYDLVQPVHMVDRIISYDRVVKPGGIVKAERLIYDEPKGCNIYVERFLVQVPNFNKEYLFEIYRHDSDDNANPVKLSLQYHIPKTVLTGDYLIISNVSYYCSWRDYLFGARTLHRVPLQIEVRE